MSLSSLCLWFKLFYFLRVFESTGFLVRAIMICMYDMRFFLILLLVVLIAFGDGYKCISLANDDEKDQFIGGGMFTAIYYAYMVSLG